MYNVDQMIALTLMVKKYSMEQMDSPVRNTDIKLLYDHMRSRGATKEEFEHLSEMIPEFKTLFNR